MMATGGQPRESPHRPNEAFLSDLIAEIDELQRQQMLADARRHEALAATAAARKDVDLAQDLINNSLQRMAELDDDVCHARAVLGLKQKTLEKTRGAELETRLRALQLTDEVIELEEEWHQQKKVVVDLQRSLMDAGVAPEEVLKLQQGAMSAKRNRADNAAKPPERPGSGILYNLFAKLSG